MPGAHTKLALRSLRKNKAFTALNILGLTLGLTTFLLIVLYIRDELSYDRFNTNADRIVRINTDLYNDGQFTAFADAPPPVARTLKTHYPEVEDAARICPQTDTRFRQGGQEIAETRVAATDPELFKLFTLPVIDGDPVRGMQQPGTAVLTASAALRYFHTTHAAGKILSRLDEKTNYTVAAVIADLPAQCSFHYDIFLAIGDSKQLNGDNFYALFPMSTFVLLKPGADQQALNKKLTGFMRQFVSDYGPIEDDNKGNYYMRLSSMPLTDIHLHSHRSDELGINGDSQYVYIFSAIAVFVLLIAGINFMNLSTARSANRAREVGVRKVLGSRRGQLIAQFLTESLITTGIASLIAFGLTALVLPAFNGLTGKELALNGAVLRWLVPTLLLIVAVVGLFSGAYPAFFLSAFRPVQVLKGKLSLGGKGSGMRSALVVIQFSISIFLIVGTLIVYRQLDYIQHRDPGYNRSQVLIVHDVDGVPQPEVFKKQILPLPGVVDATLTEFLPTNEHRWHNWGSIKGGTDMTVETQLWMVDEDYIPTMGMSMVLGRNFSPEMPTDSNAIILNETAARQYGIAKNPLNRTVRYRAFFGGPGNFNVIGIVKDFNFTSVRTGVKPLVLVNRHYDQGALNIRVAAGQIPKVLARVKAAWTAYVPHKPFNYSFMEEDFDGLYRAEQRMGNVVIVLTTLAILIACLGLFGLATYAAEQRAKEIGIRKILGANVPSILTLLSKDFARLIAIALAIATPLAWWSMHRWLESFAYRATITAWVFVAAAGIVLVVAMVTTLFQSVRAATANPVEALRSE